MGIWHTHTHSINSINYILKNVQGYLKALFNLRDLLKHWLGNQVGVKCFFVCVWHLSECVCITHGVCQSVSVCRRVLVRSKQYEFSERCSIYEPNYADHQYHSEKERKRYKHIDVVPYYHTTYHTTIIPCFFAHVPCYYHIFWTCTTVISCFWDVPCFFGLVPANPEFFGHVPC